jgi:hypothetical protein
LCQTRSISFHFRSFEGHRTEGSEGNKGFPDSSSGPNAGGASFAALQTRLFKAQFFVPLVFFCSKTSYN